MTPEIATVLAILALAIILFVTERIRVDIVALMVLVALALTGLVTSTEALSGFANLAVVTVWAVLILSAGLARTGVASMFGGPLLRLSGGSEVRLIALIMLTVGVLSGFMNDIGVAALMLPVVVDIARRTGRPPSKLLIPLAFAALLGGLNTLIGTPPNILISDALRQYGLEPFRMFDYTPTGVAVMVTGIAFMLLVGRHLLPARDIKEMTTGSEAEPGGRFGLHERLFVARLPAGSPLVGKTLMESRLGSALGLNVVGIMREGRTELAPGAESILLPGDRLLVEAHPDRLAELRGKRQLLIDEQRPALDSLVSSEIGLAEVALRPDSSLAGKTLGGIDFRSRYDVIVLAIRRGDVILRRNLEAIPIQQSDVLLVQGAFDQIERLGEFPDLLVSKCETTGIYRLEEMLMAVRVPEHSSLAGKTLVESRLGDAFHLGVLGIVREGTAHLAPDPDERLEAGDTLLMKGTPEDLEALEALQSLEIEEEPPPDLDELETEEIGLVEAVLSPYSALPGRTLREIHFRDRYGLTVLAIWRQGRPYRTDLRDMTLELGDALLLYGPRLKLKVLGADREFLVLTEEAQEPPRKNKAPVALGIMALVLLPVILGWLPISISAVAGVVLMVLTGCLTMGEAYRSIEWKAIFLIAGMLPLGIAMERTGAANWLAEGMVNLVGGLGPLAVLAGLFLLAALASQVMPNPAVAVLLAPIAMNTARDIGISPYPLMMTVAISASAAFLSPVGHSANVLIMGPGGYRFADYSKVGIPLTLTVLVVVLVVVPLVWSF
jgi:di/tricarboxylate transporter